MRGTGSLNQLKTQIAHFKIHKIGHCETSYHTWTHVQWTQILHNSYKIWYIQPLNTVQCILCTTQMYIQCSSDYVIFNYFFSSSIRTLWMGLHSNYRRFACKFPLFEYMYSMSHHTILLCNISGSVPRLALYELILYFTDMMQ